jgi:hypothetical protein
LITFHIHDDYRSIGKHRMNNVRSIPLALQFPLSADFKPRIVEEDLISFFEFLLIYLRTMCGSRISGWSLPCVISD